MVPQPWREAGEVLLAEVASGDRGDAVGAIDKEGEDEEDEEGDDEGGHGEEGGFVPVGADEAGEEEEEDRDAGEDDGPAESVDTGQREYTEMRERDGLRVDIWGLL